MKVCSVDGCEKPDYRNGWCAMHNWRWREKGDLHYVRVEPTPAERLWRRVDKAAAGGCWIWGGPCTPEGYGLISIDGRNHGTHRLAYELLVGPIAEGLHLDHLCRNPPCCNPAHLEAVTPRENTLRSPIAPAAINARKTHCIHGHEFTPENIYRRGERGRECRACMQIRDRRYKARRRGAA